jgi:hypothetical protein
LKISGQYCGPEQNRASVPELEKFRYAAIKGLSSFEIS